jgi:hypothetical protein
MYIFTLCLSIQILYPISVWINRMQMNEYEYINRNNILDNNQYGLTPNSSPVKATFKLTKEILKAMNNKLNDRRGSAALTTRHPSIHKS